jgi:hypothetical protein
MQTTPQVRNRTQTYKPSLFFLSQQHCLSTNRLVKTKCDFFLYFQKYSLKLRSSARQERGKCILDNV